jgi:hypothetical protein
MEQFSILPLGTFPAAGEDQHRGVQARGIGTSRALGNNDLDEKDFASRRPGWSPTLWGQPRIKTVLSVPVLPQYAQRASHLATG